MPVIDDRTMGMRQWGLVAIATCAITACGNSQNFFGTGGASATGGEGGTPATGGSGGNPSTGGESSTGGNPSTGGSPSTGGTGGMPSTGGGPSTGGSGQGGAGGSCDDLVVDAVNELKPADVIFVVDNSGSMGEEIDGIEQNINTNFAQLMAASGIDYRVIMLTQHGASSLHVCVAPPLSGTTNCAGPPVAVPGQFYHYSANVQSHDSWCKILNTFYGNEPDQFNLAPGGWSQWLRPEAVKAFVEVSDDGSSCTWNGTTFNDGNQEASGQTAAVAFDQQLLALSPLHFGNAASRNYVWYSLIGLGAKNPAMPLEPWNEFDPVTTTECVPGAVDPGTGYQWLSKGTGGLRYPLCDPSGYNVIFQGIADGVGDAAKEPCAFEVPLVNGQKPNEMDLSVVYTPNGNGNPINLSLVGSAALCGPNNFYIDNDSIVLCPSICTSVTADTASDVDVVIDCAGP